MIQILDNQILFNLSFKIFKNQTNKNLDILNQFLVSILSFISLDKLTKNRSKNPLGFFKVQPRINQSRSKQKTNRGVLKNNKRSDK